MNTIPDANSTTDDTSDDDFEWAVVEIMGHRRHAGRVREEERFGAKMLRIDVPKLTPEPPAGESESPSFSVERWLTHWYGGPSIFSFVLTDEASVMKINRPYVSPQRYIAPPDHGEFEDECDDDAEPCF